MITAGMVTGCSQPASSARSTATALPTATPAAAGAAGLVKALHPHCDVGDKVLNYLATGDNGGDPQLDVLLSKYVGVDLPQARAIADQQIQQCDANLSRQEAAQASATAAALEAADAAKKKATQDSSCAAIGGRVDTTWGWCASTVKGNPSGEPGSDCSYAQVAFNPDGTLAKWSSSTTKDSYPGCFQL